MNMNFIKTIFSFVILAIVFSGCKKEPFEWDDDTNGPTESTIEMVDLGLSVKWASCNIGAILPWQFGNYYSWGEVSTKDEYNPENSVTNGVHLINFSGDATYDAARALWGGKWRLPTRAELNELVKSCSWHECYYPNGVFAEGPNGKSIFFPYGGFINSVALEEGGSVGYYWSSERYSVDRTEASCLYLDYREHRVSVSSQSRYMGFNIRPVSE